MTPTHFMAELKVRYYMHSAGGERSGTSMLSKDNKGYSDTVLSGQEADRNNVQKRKGGSNNEAGPRAKDHKAAHKLQKRCIRINRKGLFRTAAERA